MRTLKLVSLLAVLCLLGSGAAHRHGGCLLVQKIAGLPELSCAVCYRSQPNAPKSVGCGHPASDQDKCRFYEYFPAVKGDKCAQCLAGSALRLKDFTCVPGTIDNCVAEYVNPKGGRLCYGCKNGYAQLAKDGTSTCIPTAKVTKTIANCQIGGLYEKFGQATQSNCYQCAAGYTLSFNSQTCTKTTITGCLRTSQDGNRCQECDVYQGYSQQPDYSCLKVG